MKIAYSISFTRICIKWLLVIGLTGVSTGASSDQFEKELLKKLQREQFIDVTKTIFATETADQKLQNVYMNYMLLKTCVEIRQDYIVQFVSPTEFSTAKKHTKAIEKHFKPTLKLSTDVVWNNAVKFLQKNPQASGADTFKVLRNQPLESLKADCETFVFRDGVFTDLILGKEKVSKDF